MNPKCVFFQALLNRRFDCPHADTVVRRGGQEYDCTSPTAYRKCETLFTLLKTAALPAFGVEDDPLTMPHSVPVKIQLGGLSALADSLDKDTTAGRPGIPQLIENAIRCYGALDRIPCDGFVENMVNYRLGGRRGKGRQHGRVRQDLDPE